MRSFILYTILIAAVLYVALPPIEYSWGDPPYAKEYYSKLDLHNLHDEVALLNVGIVPRLADTLRDYASVLVVSVVCANATGEVTRTDLTPSGNQTLLAPNAARTWPRASTALWHTYSLLFGRQVESVSTRIRTRHSADEWPLTLQADTSCLQNLRQDAVPAYVAVSSTSPYTGWSESGVPEALQVITQNSIRHLAPLLDVKTGSAKAYLHGVINNKPIFKRTNT